MAIKAQFVRVYDKYRVDLTHMPSELHINFGDNIDSIRNKVKEGVFKCGTIATMNGKRGKAIMCLNFEYIPHDDEGLPLPSMKGNLGFTLDKYNRIHSFTFMVSVPDEKTAIELRDAITDLYIRKASYLDKRTNIIWRVVDFDYKPNDTGVHDGLITYSKRQGKYQVVVMGDWKYKMVTDYDS